MESRAPRTATAYPLATPAAAPGAKRAWWAGLLLAACWLLPAALSYAQSPSSAEYVNRGVALAQERRLAEAIRAFRSALALDPRSRDARYNLALAYHDSGDYRRAVAEFQAVLEADPRALDARKGLGLSLIGLRRWPEAVRALQVVLAAVPEDPVALAALGRAYMGAGNAAKAVVAFEHAAALRPQEPGLLFELGRAQAACKDHVAARSSFNAALLLKPTSPAVAAALAREQIATGLPLMAVETLRPFAQQARPDRRVLLTLIAAYEALKLKDEALQVRVRLAETLPPKEALPLRVELGNTLLQQARWREALAQFQAAVTADPRGVAAYLGMARAYQGLEDKPRELAAWLGAAGLGPQRAEAWVGAARALAAQSDPEGARRALRKALAASLAPGPVLRAAADVARSLEEPELVEGFLRRALALAPDDLKARMSLVDFLAEEGDLRRALLEAAEALRGPHAPAEAYMRLAFLAEQAGNLELAMTQWRRLMARRGKEELAAALELGRLLVATGRVPAALELYRDQLKRRPEATELALGLARAHQAIGQDEEAVALLQPLVAARPTLTEARVALAESLSWLNRHQEAWAQIQGVMAAGPPGEGACRVLALVCERAGRRQEGILLLERLLPGGGLEEVGLEVLARLYREERRQAEGGRRLLALLDRYPAHPRLGLAAARLLAAGGERAQSEQVLGAMSRREAVRGEALQQWVELEITSGAAERALQPLEDRVGASPRAPWLLALLAELRPRPDLVRQVAPTLLKLARAEPESPGFWLAAADLAHFFGRDRAELGRLTALAAQSPADPGLATGVAALALYDGRPAQAERVLLVVPPAKRTDRALLHTLARAQVALGKHAEAMGSLGRIISGGQALPEDYVLAAELWRQQRRSEEALFYVTEALRISPGDGAARQALEEIMRAGELGPAALMEGIKRVYYYHPDTPVVFELVNALSDRPDARPLCQAWLSRHPKPRGTETQP